MKRGARFRAGGRSGRWEVQLRGGRSRVTPCAPASERPLALSSSLRCKSELQILMRGKYRSGGARPARSRPPPAPGCVRSHGDAGEGPGPPPTPGPVHRRCPRGSGARLRPHPPNRAHLPRSADRGYRFAGKLAPGVEWPVRPRGESRGAAVGVREERTGAIERLRLPGRRGWRPRHPRAGTRAPPQASADAVTPPRAGLVNRVGTGSYRAGAGPPPHPLLRSLGPSAR